MSATEKRETEFLNILNLISLDVCCQTATVTVTLKKTPISTEDSTTGINIAITATPAA